MYARLTRYVLKSQSSSARAAGSTARGMGLMEMNRQPAGVSHGVRLRYDAQSLMPPWSLSRYAMASLVACGVVLAVPSYPQIRHRHRVVSTVAIASNWTT